AAVIGDAGVDHDAVARLDGADVGPDGVDHSRPVRAQDVGEAVLHGQAAHDVEVEVVQRRGADRDAHVTGVQRLRGEGDIGKLQAIEAAGRADNASAHRRLTA